MRTITALLLAGAFTGSALAQPAETVARANEEYRAERFVEAIDLYKQAAAAGRTNAALFYNLGNAQYRTGDFGGAILNYQRALTLEPQHPEADANLRVARDKARALELRTSWWERLTARISSAYLAIAAAASFWIAALATTALLMFRRRSATIIATLAIAILSLGATASALYARETGSRGRSLAIVTAKNIEARLATADNAGSVLVLPPGSEINILSTRGDWIYAALPNDLRGWIPATSAERVRL